MNWKKLFKKKTKIEKLQDKYDSLKYFEANELLLEIESLEK